MDNKSKLSHVYPVSTRVSLSSVNNSIGFSNNLILEQKQRKSAKFQYFIVHWYYCYDSIHKVPWIPRYLITCSAQHHFLREDWPSIDPYNSKIVCISLKQCMSEEKAIYHKEHPSLVYGFYSNMFVQLHLTHVKHQPAFN